MPPAGPEAPVSTAVETPEDDEPEPVSLAAVPARVEPGPGAARSLASSAEASRGGAVAPAPLAVPPVGPLPAIAADVSRAPPPLPTPAEPEVVAAPPRSAAIASVSCFLCGTRMDGGYCSHCDMTWAE
jgi:hypothetical protein